MYIEASRPMQPGDTARLESPLVPDTLCGENINFWYHMYGAEIGSLRVYFKRDGVLGAPVWTMEGKPN